MAEWSKALVLGTSPKGRGFESHRCHVLFCNFPRPTNIRAVQSQMPLLKTVLFIFHGNLFFHLNTNFNSVHHNIIIFLNVFDYKFRPPRVIKA